MKLTEEFIARVHADLKDALSRRPHVSGYRLSVEFPYGGAVRDRLYEALAILEKRGDIVAIQITQHGGYERRNYALRGAVKPLPPKRGNHVATKPYRNIYAPAQPKITFCSEVSAEQRQDIALAGRS